MASNRFALRLGLRLIVILCLMIGFAALWWEQDWRFVQILLAVLIAGLVAELWWFMHGINRELAKLLLAVRHSDFSISFSRKQLDSTHEGLHDVFKELIQAYRTIKTDREAQFRFMQSLIRHVDFGIVAVSDSGKILLMNSPAQEMLGTMRVQEWRQLVSRHPTFAQAIASMEESGSSLVEWTYQGRMQPFSVRQSQFKILETPYRLLSFRAIGSEINQKELEAWNRLIRILTHEIMNTVTPIASLSDTLSRMVSHKGETLPVEGMTQEKLEDIAFSLHMIKDRSEGILHFVEDYRRLTKIPRPNLQPTDANSLLEGVALLMHAELQHAEISLSTQGLNYDVQFPADKALVEQVILNLMRNSLEALEGSEDKQLTLRAEEQSQYLIITVQDNGPGVPIGKRPEIFTPFFSTKENGSGIGLSLSRQIMAMHGGSLYLDTEVEAGACLRMVFPRR